MGGMLVFVPISFWMPLCPRTLLTGWINWYIGPPCLLRFRNKRPCLSLSTGYSWSRLWTAHNRWVERMRLDFILYKPLPFVRIRKKLLSFSIDSWGHLSKICHLLILLAVFFAIQRSSLISITPLHGGRLHCPPLSTCLNTWSPAAPTVPPNPDPRIAPHQVLNPLGDLLCCITTYNILI